jgi:uncharacterized protein
MTQPVPETARAVARIVKTLAVDVLDGLDAVRPDAWDRLVEPGERGLSHGYLTAWEHVELAGLRSRPLVARRGDRIAAAAPGYFYDLDLAAMKGGRLAGAVALVRRLIPRFLVLRIYEVGCPTGLSGPLLCDSSVEVRRVARELFAEAVAEAERGDAQLVVVEDFAGGEPANADALSALGFEPLEVMPTVWLDLPFESFDEYLRAMRAQYRRRVRKVIERSADLRVERRTEFAALAPQLARLSREMFDRAQDVKRELLGERFFRAASARDDLSLLLLRRSDGSIASFAVLFEDRPCLRFLHCGFELAAAREDAAYFRLLYEIVRCAIDERFRRVDFGVTTLAPKLDTGGVPVHLISWTRHRNPAVQRIFGAVARRSFNAGAVAARKVFKAAPAAMPQRGERAHARAA